MKRMTMSLAIAGFVAIFIGCHYSVSQDQNMSSATYNNLTIQNNTDHALNVAYRFRASDKATEQISPNSKKTLVRSQVPQTQEGKAMTPQVVEPVYVELSVQSQSDKNLQATKTKTIKASTPYKADRIMLTAIVKKKNNKLTIDIQQ